MAHAPALDPSRWMGGRWSVRSGPRASGWRRAMAPGGFRPGPPQPAWRWTRFLAPSGRPTPCWRRASGVEPGDNTGSSQERGESMFRKYSLGGYEDMRAAHRWEVPRRYNIASDVCDKHERERPAMVWEDWRGQERRISFGELQDLSNRFANVLEAAGIEPGDRVATLLPSLPETAAVFLGTYKRGAILLSMSVLYGDDGIEHRLRDSQARMLVTDSNNRDRIPSGLVERVLVMGDDFEAAMDDAAPDYETVDTAADDPAQLYYSSGTTGLAKGILHAHRYLL